MLFVVIEVPVNIIFATSVVIIEMPVIVISETPVIIEIPVIFISETLAIEVSKQFNQRK